MNVDKRRRRRRQQVGEQSREGLVARGDHQDRCRSSVSFSHTSWTGTRPRLVFWPVSRVGRGSCPGPGCVQRARMRLRVGHAKPQTSQKPLADRTPGHKLTPRAATPSRRGRNVLEVAACPHPVRRAVLDYISNTSAKQRVG